MHKDTIEKGINKIIQDTKKVKKSNDDVSMFIKENVRALYKNKNFTHSQLIKRKYDLNMLINPSSNILMSVAIGVCASLIASMLYSLFMDEGTMEIINKIIGSYPANLRNAYTTRSFKAIAIAVVIPLIMILFIGAVPILIAIMFIAFLYAHISPGPTKLEVYIFELEIITDILKLNKIREQTNKEDTVNLKTKSNEPQKTDKAIALASIIVPLFASGIIVYFQRKNDK